MLLDVSPILDQSGSTLPFEVSLDLSELTFGGCRTDAPVKAAGTVRNTAGVFVLSSELQSVLRGVCDRCAKELVREIRFPLHAILSARPQDDGEEDPWSFPLENNKADLDEIVTTAFVLSMEPKFLCREDCKGLCPRCGKDLNDGPCDCRPEPDPRFAVLSQLLKNS